MTKDGKIYIGTSGWKYEHWNGIFYPDEIKKKDQLNFFTSKFGTVELNNSFYRQPTAANFKQWKDNVPGNFVYAVKANRFFTHLKKLKVSAEDLNQFLSSARQLGNKLGPVLFQLPPRWKINIERFREFLAILPKDMRFTVEFRDQSWYTLETYELLRSHGIAFCIYELAGHLSPILSTTDFVYVRLHGPSREKYQGSYELNTLKIWAKQCLSWAKEKKDVFIYFDNDQKGYAAFNALELKELVKIF